MPHDLKRRLERYAQISRRGKNWIIVEAVEAYLTRETGDEIAEEARRQSKLAAGVDAIDTAWERAVAEDLTEE